VDWIGVDWLGVDWLGVVWFGLVAASWRSSDNGMAGDANVSALSGTNKRTRSSARSGEPMMNTIIHGNKKLPLFVNEQQQTPLDGMKK